MRCLGEQQPSPLDNLSTPLCAYLLPTQRNFLLSSSLSSYFFSNSGLFFAVHKDKYLVTSLWVCVMCAQTRMHTHTLTQVCTHTYTHVHTHTPSHPHMHTHTRTYMGAVTYMHSTYEDVRRQPWALVLKRHLVWFFQTEFPIGLWLHQLWVN